MKRFETCTTTINGKEYTAQFNGTQAFYDAQDAIRFAETGVQSMAKTIAYLVKHVLVEPADLNIDDLSIDECEELAAFLMKILRGNNKDYIKAQESAPDKK